MRFAAVVGVLVAADDGQHPKAQHLGQAMANQSRITLVAGAPGHKVDQAAATLLLAQQHQAAAERRRHFPATNGWNIEGKNGIVGYGGCGQSVVWVERRLDNEFLPDFNELRHTRRPKIRLSVNNPGYPHWRPQSPRFAISKNSDAR